MQHFFFVDHIESPIGTVFIQANEHGITSISFSEGVIEEPRPSIHTEKGKTQLQEYFNSERKKFELDLVPDGTEYQQRVWEKLREIGFGQTSSYGELADQLENTSARAVGTANSKNPIAIVIPCHRVISKDSSLTGYAGGIWRKQWLLEHEHASFQKQLF